MDLWNIFCIVYNMVQQKARAIYLKCGILLPIGHDMLYVFVIKHT